MHTQIPTSIVACWGRLSGWVQMSLLACLHCGLGLASRRHARVRLERGVWLIEDLGSRNGTRVDGNLVDQFALPRRADVRLYPAGPLLRIGHDRYIPGLTRLVETVRRASGGRTRLFIQLIDFLAIKRRPPKDKFFGRFLELDDAYRAALAEVTGEPSLREASEAVVRERFMALDEAMLENLVAHHPWSSFRSMLPSSVYVE